VSRAVSLRRWPALFVPADDLKGIEGQYILTAPGFRVRGGAARVPRRCGALIDVIATLGVTRSGNAGRARESARRRSVGESGSGCLVLAVATRARLATAGLTGRPVFAPAIFSELGRPGPHDVPRGLTRRNGAAAMWCT